MLARGHESAAVMLRKSQETSHTLREIRGKTQDRTRTTTGILFTMKGGEGRHRHDHDDDLSLWWW